MKKRHKGTPLYQEDYDSIKLLLNHGLSPYTINKTLGYSSSTVYLIKRSDSLAAYQELRKQQLEHAPSGGKKLKIEMVDHAEPAKSVTGESQGLAHSDCHGTDERVLEKFDRIIDLLVDIEAQLRLTNEKSDKKSSFWIRD